VLEGIDHYLEFLVVDLVVDFPRLELSSVEGHRV